LLVVQAAFPDAAIWCKACSSNVWSFTLRTTAFYSRSRGRDFYASFVCGVHRPSIVQELLLVGTTEIFEPRIVLKRVGLGGTSGPKCP
jgi:hypothetical protein